MAAHHALARQIAAEGMVLLKNDGILPLQRSTAHRRDRPRGAENAHFQGGGSSHINPTQVDVPLDELEKLAGGAGLTFSRGLSGGRLLPARPDR